eukprot:GFUD01047084.1.p1 GENE.GFUD01047084.1~~GFUD01047084.1.p1  ORF type:complete len:104 (+),score=21.37 GFUD01047084.1:111-422(+)
MKVVLALSCMAAVASAMPYPMAYPGYPAYPLAYPQAVYPEEAVYRFPRQADLATAADTGYAAPGPVGRVKIQVYRGPSKGDYDFAPWGYYNTQPADLGVASYH